MCKYKKRQFRFPWMQIKNVGRKVREAGEPAETSPVGALGMALEYPLPADGAAHAGWMLACERLL